MKKVLMIARVFPPFFPVGFSIRVVKFIKYLPALGWLPVVLTVDDQQEYETLRKVGSETQLSEIQPQVKIYRTATCELSLKSMEREWKFGQRNWLTAAIMKVLSLARRGLNGKLLLPDRYLTWLPIALRRGRQIVSSEGIDVIFATCPPYSSSLIGTCLKLLTGRPLVLDFRDDWIDTPWYRSKPQIVRVIERSMEKFAVKRADKVILVTEWSKDAFLKRYPSEPHAKFVLITNGADLAEFADLNSVALPQRKPTFTIVHAGTLNDLKMAWGRSPARLFQAVQHALQQEPELQEKLTLVFAGDLPERNRRLAHELGLSGVVKAVGHLPHDEVLCLTKSADLLLAINYEGWSTLIPGKIFEYWAVGGAPILLLSCPGAAASFVEQHGLGITVEPDDVTGIEQAILTVYRQSKTATPLRVSANGIEAYDRRALTARLAELLSIASERRQDPC